LNFPHHNQIIGPTDGLKPTLFGFNNIIQKIYENFATGRGKNKTFSQSIGCVQDCSLFSCNHVECVHQGSL
jgi:hypothetical protein